MLKIKDNINLQELEKLGFYKGNERTYCYEIPPLDERDDCDDIENITSNFSTDGFAMVEIDTETRVISFFTTTDDEVWWGIDIMFDLMTSGLVEKEN